MIKKNEDVNVRKNIGKRKNKAQFGIHDIRAILLTIIIAAFAIFVIMRMAFLIRVMAGSAKTVLDKWVNREISCVKMVDVTERRI